MPDALPCADWFVSSGVPSPAARVFCFPAAGSDPRAFLDLQPGIGIAGEIVAVCMPGRWHRAGEPGPASLVALADAAAAAISAWADRPFVLFGHSMGAVVAFEVARRLGNQPGFRHLVASACNAPRLNPSDYILWSDGNYGRAFAEEAASFLGLSSRFVEASDEVQELLLADLRADVHLLAEYRYEPAAPLATDVSLICGRDDPHIDEEGVGAWREECERTPRIHWIEGDHFYLERRPSAVTDVLRPIAAAGEHIEVI